MFRRLFLAPKSHEPFVHTGLKICGCAIESDDTLSKTANDATLFQHILRVDAWQRGKTAPR
jgi:hypothetical protein